MNKDTPKKEWIRNGEAYFPNTISEGTKFDKLKPGVYTIKESRMGLYLENTAKEFSFNHKIYGLNTRFIKRCLTSFNNTDSNMGVLLNGLKGTGKTVTAKILANLLELPIIVIKETFEGAAFDFLAENITQDSVIMIDEFEKTISEDDQKKMLTFMDGLHNSEHKRVFILTTNKMDIDSNLIDRPSRVRYIRTFDNLDAETIIEVVDDILQKDRLHHRDELIELIKTFNIITIDNIKQFINEVNIHNESPDELFNDFNVVKMKFYYKAEDITNEDKKKELGFPIDLGDRKIENKQYISRLGTIAKVISEDTYVVNIDDDRYRYLNIRESEDYQNKRNTKGSKFDYINENTSLNEAVELIGEEDAFKFFFKKVKITKEKSTHPSFVF